MSFKTQIDDLTKFGSTDDVALKQWMEEGVRELINAFPPSLRETCYAKQTFTSNVVNSEAENLLSGQLGSVFAGSVECRQIRPMDKHKASSSTSLEYASATDPVFYVEGGKINILPGSSSGTYYVIANPSITVASDSSISNFPNEAEYLVVLYASKKALQRLLNDKSDSLPSDVSPIALIQVSSSLPSYTSPSSFVLPVPPPGADIDFSSVGTIETFISPVFSAPSLGSIDAMSLPTAPSVPVLSGSIEVSTTNLTNPTFTPPVMSAPDFTDTNTWISTEEDSEMLAARVQEIQSKIGEYTARLQESQAQFNKDSSILQKDLQIAIQDAQLKSNVDAQKLQKYSSEIQSYQADVNKEIQKWTSETFGKAYQEWTQKYQGQLQEYSADLQKETARVSSSLNEFQAQVAKALQKYQAETGYDLGKYQSEVQANVQKFNSDLTKNSTEFQNDLQKYMSEVQKVSADNQSLLGKFGQDLANYGAKIQKQSLDYQWLQSQLAQVMQDYAQGLQILVGSNRPPQQQQGGQ